MGLLRLDPVAWGRQLWDVAIYKKQLEIVYSVEENDETYVTAANKVGKDWIAGYIVSNWTTRALKEGKTCRIITTSVAEHHLKVLWGEIGRFMTSSKQPLLVSKEHPHAPLIMNFQEIRRSTERAAKNPLSYTVGRVSEKGEGLAGHHAEITLFVGDEASGLDDKCYEMAQGWAKRMLIFGNPNACTNFFYRAVNAGDVLSLPNGQYATLPA